MGRSERAAISEPVSDKNAETHRHPQDPHHRLRAVYSAMVVIPSEARDLLLSRQRSYFVYLLASRSRNIYTGITNDLERRVYEHKTGRVPGFTTRYRIHRLVYFETFGSVHAAIAREKQIKAWRREKRVALIEKNNPAWNDLSDDWYKPKVEYAALGVVPKNKQIPRSARDDKLRWGE